MNPEEQIKRRVQLALDAMTDEAIACCEDLQKGLDIHFHITPAASYAVIMEPGRLQQVIEAPEKGERQ